MTPARPSLRDVAVLLGLQIGVAALAAAVLSLLPMAGPQGWVAGLGCMIGAQSFVLFKTRKHPDAFDGSYAHRLALYASLGQLALGALAAGAFALADPQAAQLLGISVALLVLIVAAISVPLGYGLTRLGFRMGLSAAARARKAQAK